MKYFYSYDEPDPLLDADTIRKLINSPRRIAWESELVRDYNKELSSLPNTVPFTIIDKDAYSLLQRDFGEVFEDEHRFYLIVATAEHPTRNLDLEHVLRDLQAFCDGCDSTIDACILHPGDGAELNFIFRGGHLEYNRILDLVACFCPEPDMDQQILQAKVRRYRSLGVIQLEKVVKIMRELPREDT